jgi:hypothetical protein
LICFIFYRNHSPAKSSVKRSKDKEIPKEVLTKKPKEPAEEVMPEQKLPDASKTPPPAPPQMCEISHQPVPVVADDTKKPKILHNDLAIGNGEPSSMKPPESCEIVGDTQNQQQLSFDQPDQAVTFPDDTDASAENGSLGNDNLNTSGQSGRSYVIEVVNENEFECFVSLNRKKKRKKVRKKSVEQIE